MDRFLACSFFDCSEARVAEWKRGSECLKEREIDDLIFVRLASDDELRCLAHLLCCGPCQERVEAEREFARATRNAAILLQQEELATASVAPKTASWAQRLAGWFGAPFSTPWAAVAASVCVLVALGIYLPLHRAADGGTEVLLQSERGIPTPATVESAASGHLRLRIDISDVSPLSSYHLALVDSLGRVLESKTVAPTGASVSLPVERSLARARYWIRLSAPDGQLLREYALQVY
jgi:hypothetical protein